ncbi:hypothetical protein Tsubulata_037380 [Turnera subulata]|uniref:Pentacotripeptide-repeat region of PRORP domain-containing protein n=1 Tax=Turnera subulata TaxID=218843 RepID=A0A9Q0J1D4_9ROSI|nr:hypothetical protein Tsubulata_037380 [Turnera subulata]
MSKTCREIERKILRLLHGPETRTQLRQIHAHFLRHGLGQINQILAHFVSICGSLNRMPYANRIFHQTHNPNIFLFNAMIKGYSISGPFDESLHLFSSMKTRGIWPDEYTFAPLLKACSSLGDLKLGQCVHKEIIVAGFEWFSSVRIGVVELYSNCGVMRDARQVFDEMRQRDVIVWNLMVQGYCKRGDVNVGLSLFRKMSERSVVSWNIMISCLARSGRDGEALGLFQEMRDQGFKPDEGTVVAVLPVCARLVEKGRNLFSSMTLDHQIEPKPEHFGCMVDLLGRSGCVREAYDMIRSMPGLPTAALWGALLSACRTHGAVDLAELAIKELIALEPWNSGNYVLLSNIYANEERWDEVEKVRVMMRERDIKKAAGLSATG